MIPRQLADALDARTRGYAAIVITGPRQSSKTTFAKTAFPELPYCNLESPIERSMAADDEVAFLARFPEGAVLDEVQRAPDLLSALQVRIDATNPGAARWVLTGSQQFELTREASQSLAGRAARLELLPLSYDELAASERRPKSPSARS